MTLELDKRAAQKYVRLQQSAQRRGIEFALPFTSLKNLYRAKRCFFTGVELVLGGDRPNSLTIDRVDNNRGYVPGNVVACSHAFNQAKGDLSVEAVRALVRGFNKKGLL
jgi:hypothetical protein